MDHVKFEGREKSYKRFSARGLGRSKQAKRFQLYVFLALTDALGICLAYSLAGLLRRNQTFLSTGLHLAILVVPLFLLTALNNQAYGYQVLVNWQQGLKKALIALGFSVSAVLFVAFYTRASLEFSRVVYGAGSVGSLLFLVIGRNLFGRFVSSAGESRLRADLVIVDGCEAPRFEGARLIQAADYGLRPNLRDPQMLNRLGNVVRDAEFVLVCCPIEDRPVWSLLLKGTDVQGYVMAPEFDQVGAHRLGNYGGQCVMQVASGPLDLRSRILKRVMDLAITIPVIILSSPLLLLTALLIKLDSDGPILFRQQRMGRGNRLIFIWKFRSMHSSDRDLEGALSVTQNDARVTRIGRVIRATSIDELPQLFNVLHGDMSLVGPRPHALGSLAGIEHFWEVDQRYWHRHSLKPGITGLAQVRGLRGPTREREDLVRRLQADLEYLNNWSLWRDICILAATARVFVHPNAF